MADDDVTEGSDEWDLFTPGGDGPDEPPARRTAPPPRASRPPRPARPRALPPEEADGEASSDDDGWDEEDVWGDDRRPAAAPFLQSAALPWVAVAVAVLVVLVVIVVSKGGDDKNDQVGTTTPGVTAPGGAPAASTTEANNCPGFSQGTNLLGPPQVSTEPGVHVWHDVEGFHLRLVKGEGSVDEVSGTLTPTGTALTIVDPQPPAATLDAGKITFALKDDTLDVLFKASCTTTAVTFELTSAGAPLPVTAVSIGRDAVPAAVPFTLTRGLP